MASTVLFWAISKSQPALNRFVLSRYDPSKFDYSKEPQSFGVKMAKKCGADPLSFFQFKQSTRDFLETRIGYTEEERAN